MLSAVVIAAALAGCGAQEEQSQAETQAGGQEEAQQNGSNGTAQQSDDGAGMRPMGAQADLMGKVKSIEGQTITLYKSALPTGQGGPPPGDGTGERPADGKGQQPPAVDGTAPGGGRMKMDEMFSDETVEIQVTETTKIVSITFENEQMVEKKVALADLKADDILSVMLKDDTQEAESITIRTGGFGDMGGGPPRQQDQQAAAAQ